MALDSASMAAIGSIAVRAAAELVGEADPPTIPGAGSAAWPQPTATLVQECRARAQGS